MITIKQTLKKLDLELDLPEVLYRYPMMADYETYNFTTINNQKCIELKGFIEDKIPMKCIINLDIKRIME